MLVGGGRWTILAVERRLTVAVRGERRAGRGTEGHRGGGVGGREQGKVFGRPEERGCSRAMGRDRQRGTLARDVEGEATQNNETS